MTQEKHTPEEQPRRSGKPVLIYIMILFIAAFLLMALSFAMHQRSNQQAMGELETTFHTTIKDMQADQDKLLELQKELSETKAALEAAEIAVGEAEGRMDAAEIDLEGMRMLYAVQQKYSAGDYEACAALIAEMEELGLAALLPSTQVSTNYGSVTAPFVRFQQLKAAVQEKLAEPAAE